MKSAHLVCLLVCLLFAAFVHAQEKDDPAKDKQIEQQVLKDIKKTCTPQKKQSDKEWQDMILSSEANRLLIKNAITAVKRDNWTTTGRQWVRWIVWKIIKREATASRCFSERSRYTPSYKAPMLC